MLLAPAYLWLCNHNTEQAPVAFHNCFDFLLVTGKATRCAVKHFRCYKKYKWMYQCLLQVSGMVHNCSMASSQESFTRAGGGFLWRARLREFLGLKSSKYKLNYKDHQHDLWTMSGIFHSLLTVITEIIRTHLLWTLTHASLVMLRLLYQTSFSDKFHSHFIILQKPTLKAKVALPDQFFR